MKMGNIDKYFLGGTCTTWRDEWIEKNNGKLFNLMLLCRDMRKRRQTWYTSVWIYSRATRSI